MTKTRKLTPAEKATKLRADRVLRTIGKALRTNNVVMSPAMQKIVGAVVSTLLLELDGQLEGLEECYEGEEATDGEADTEGA